MDYRLGLDLGSNSIGWCMLELDASGEPRSVINAGVRILTSESEAGRDAKSKQPLAVERREARGRRRRRDRFVRRQKRLMQLLVSAGLMPQDPAERKALERLDPYYLRAQAIETRIAAHEIGRALFHLNQRRAFKSNRISDAKNDDEQPMKLGIGQLNAALEEEGVATLGQYLARRHQRDKTGRREGSGQPSSTRFRPRVESSKNHYDLFADRALVEAELDAIYEAQRQYHPELLTEALLQRLKRIIIEQRPLKAPIRGRCTLSPDEKIDARFTFPLDGTGTRVANIDLGERAPKCHPLFQRFRILQDVGQLELFEKGKRARKLNRDEFCAICMLLTTTRTAQVKFSQLRKAAKLPKDAYFNYELRGNKDGLTGDETAYKLMHKNGFGKAWRSLSREQQIEVVERLLLVEDEALLQNWLQSQFELSKAAAEYLSTVRLPQGYGQLGRGVLEKLVEVMEQGGDLLDPNSGELRYQAPPLTYDQAVRMIGGHHSKLESGPILDRLPYYGEVLGRHVIAKKQPYSAQQPGREKSQDEIGRLSNPTVHIGLNQVRAVVNQLIEAHGKPKEIVVELARELKLNQKRKDNVQKRNRENQQRNEERRSELEKQGLPDNYDNRLRLRLYEALPPDERVCIYSGTAIGRSELFSPAIEVDHILPHSRTLDDSFANKVLCTRSANRQKRNRSPAEVSEWSAEQLEEIRDRARRIMRDKVWRFEPDAMEKYEAQGDLPARLLNDTRYLSLRAKDYLKLVCDQTWVIPGKMTAMLRHHWGLNSLLPDHNIPDSDPIKNRKDHRHHAIDAFVVACTSRSLVNAISTAAGQAEQQALEHLFPKDGVPQPYPGYREELRGRLESLVVSHKRDHGVAVGVKRWGGAPTSGRLLEESAYGLVNEAVGEKKYNLVRRIPLLDLKPKDIERVRDPNWRRDLKQLKCKSQKSGEDWKEALKAFEETRGIRRIRMLNSDQTVEEIKHGAEKQYHKAYIRGENHSAEIYAHATSKWQKELISRFYANQAGFQPRWRQEHPDAKLIMRLHKGDSLQANFGDGQQIYIVRQLNAESLFLIEHYQAGSIQKRHKDPDDPLRWKMVGYATLKKAGARLVYVDAIGRVSLPKSKR